MGLNRLDGPSASWSLGEGFCGLMDELPDLSADEGDGPELGSPSDEPEVERRPGEVQDHLEKDRLAPIIRINSELIRINSELIRIN